jgi:hypothetical protein
VKRKFHSKVPKPRNLQAMELRTPKYSLRVIPDKTKSSFRKRKHKLGTKDEKD